MSPFPLFFFFFSLMVGFGSLFLTTSALCDNTKRYCMDGANPFGYPFSERGEFINGGCGYPGLTLNCLPSEFRPVLNTSNGLYYVMSITPEESSINVVGKDVHKEECPRPTKNFTLQTSSVLSLHPSNNGNVTYFYNCSSGFPKSETQGLPCLDDYYNNSAAAPSRQLRSFAFSHSSSHPLPHHSFDSFDDLIPYDVRFDWYSRNCQETVVVPAGPNYREGNNTSNITFTVEQGFGLEWTTPDGCKACEKSGGQCWYNQTAGVHAACYCPATSPYHRRVFDKICPQQGARHTELKIILGVCSVVGGLLLLILVICRQKTTLLYGSMLSHWKSKIKSPTNVEAFLESCGCLGLQRYKYRQVKKMTNKFKEKLGQGGFGTVYKGKLPDGRFVAVKVLNISKGNGEDFMNEVATIGWTNHVNVVRLLGFCSNGSKQALVYEFMVNGSLEKFIYDRKNVSITNPSLGWEKLYQIALGIAKGLEYLHCGCNTRILHFDIKPHNILLDQDFCPKISDFGLAKLCQTRESNVSMHVARGTVGYAAPEISCINFGKVSHKSDVYSYGMMIFEMIAGRKNIDVNVENLSEIYFPQWIYNHVKQEIDVNGTEDLYTEETTRKMIMVALWCIQTQPSDRPSISKVVEMLEGSGDGLQIPPNPFQGSLSMSSAS